jgi:hypothetical protein
MAQTGVGTVIRMGGVQGEGWRDAHAESGDGVSDQQPFHHRVAILW